MTSPSPPAFELSVANGILVTPRGRRRANLYVRDGKVALITDQLLPVAERVDAKNLFVVPGMIDTHVHFMDPGASEREDFPSGTAAAAKAGVTTVIEHSHVFPVRNPVQLEAKVQYLATRSHVDFGLAAHSTPAQAGDAPMMLPLPGGLRVGRPLGRPRTRPDRVLADKAYSSRAIRTDLRARGIGSVIPEPDDQKAHRKRRGSRGGRPVTYDRNAYRGGGCGVNHPASVRIGAS